MSQKDVIQLLLALLQEDSSKIPENITSAGSNNSLIVNKLDQIYKTLIRSSKDIFTLKEAAEYTQLSESFLYKLSSNRSIRHYKPGKHIFFKKEDLDQFILSNPVK
jgi:excisionase family DNA binding protein